MSVRRFPVVPVGAGQAVVISTDSAYAIGPALVGMGLAGAPASAAWPTANKAILVPFTTLSNLVIYKVGWYNGTVAAANVDVAIYDAAGTRLVSTGSTAQSGTSVLQVVDVTDTVLPRGMYWLAMAMDSATSGVYRWAAPAAVYGAAAGVREKATSFVLPSTLTGTSALAGTVIPFVFAEAQSR